MPVAFGLGTLVPRWDTGHNERSLAHITKGIKRVCPEPDFLVSGYFTRLEAYLTFLGPINREKIIKRHVKPHPVMNT
jgi:hypothetical protein